MPRAYPVQDFRAKLGEILRAVKRGRTVTISERGRDIARVVPVDASRDLGTRLAALRRDGVIVPGRAPAASIHPLLRRPEALRRFLRTRA